MQNKNNKNKINKKGKGKKDQRVQAPVSITRQMSNPGPRFKNESNRTIITHREFIKDFEGTDVFDCDSDGINPGNPDVFPWLALVAINYESYRFRRLSFLYEPMAPTSTPGSVMLYIDYDCEDDSPNTKSQFLAQSGASRSSPWAPFKIDLDLSRLPQKTYYVRGHIYPSERKLYDVGQIMYGSDAVTYTPGGIRVGEIWVEYEVELIHPQISDLQTPSKYLLSAQPATVSLSQPWGTTPSVQGELGVSIPDHKVFSINFHGTGEYLVCLGIKGNVTANPADHLWVTDLTVGTTAFNTWAGIQTALVWMLIPVRLTRTSSPIFGVDLANCCSAVTQTFMLVIPANFNTMNGQGPYPT